MSALPTPEQDFEGTLRRLGDVSMSVAGAEAVQEAIAAMVQAGRQAEAAVALAQVCQVAREVIDRALQSDRPDALLVLCKAHGWTWPTARALLSLLPRLHPLAPDQLDLAFTNFERLPPATARRVLRFWQRGIVSATERAGGSDARFSVAES